MQRPELREQEADTAFWLNLGVGSVFLAIEKPWRRRWRRDDPSAPRCARFSRRSICCSSLRPPADPFGADDAATFASKPLAVSGQRGLRQSGGRGHRRRACLRRALRVWALVAQRLVAATLVVALVWRFSGWLPRLLLRMASGQDAARFPIEPDVAPFPAVDAAEFEGGRADHRLDDRLPWRWVSSGPDHAAWT